MNALVGHEAKANFSVIRIVCDESADDGRRNDGGNFTRTGASGHFCG